ncbi:hypothetical protein YC2023_012502 [Brassica napus]
MEILRHIVSSMYMIVAHTITREATIREKKEMIHKPNFDTYFQTSIRRITHKTNFRWTNVLRIKNLQLLRINSGTSSGGLEYESRTFKASLVVRNSVDGCDEKMQYCIKQLYLVLRDLVFKNCLFDGAVPNLSDSEWQTQVLKSDIPMLVE